MTLQKHDERGFTMSQCIALNSISRKIPILKMTLSSPQDQNVWTSLPTTSVIPFVCLRVAGRGAPGPAEEAKGSRRWARQILRVVKGCPGKAGASREESSRREWRPPLFHVELWSHFSRVVNNTVAHSLENVKAHIDSYQPQINLRNPRSTRMQHFPVTL